MPQQSQSRAAPQTGFVRLPSIIGQAEITEAEAKANRERNKGPRRPREAIAPLIPVSRSSWWAGVRAGRYPKPLKLSAGTTVWKAADILALIDQAEVA